jgi:1-acyl-sn-glycerol-3-phosphate acyltransferase
MWPMVARTGAARMALETGVPVIPVIQWGVHRILKPYGKFPHLIPRKKVTIIAGPPIELDDLRAQPIDTETLRAVSDRIMDTLTAMLEDIRGEQAPAERYDMRKKKAA